MGHSGPYSSPGHVRAERQQRSAGRNRRHELFGRARLLPGASVDQRVRQPGRAGAGDRPEAAALLPQQIEQ